MNKKGGNSWILCPSKSFPGKFYYFNVVTGEAAWCLTEDEQKTLAKDVGIKKVSDKNHSYPEPNTPPTDEGLDTSNIFYNLTPPPNLPLSYQMGPVPMFGQPVFSRYIPNQYMPGYMIPMPQMIVASKPEPKKRSFDQITQTSDIQVPCVQGYTIPLSQRFGTYRQQNIGTKIFGNKCESTQNKGDTFTSNKGNWCNTDSTEVNFSTMQGSIFGPKLNNCNEIKASTSKPTLFSSHVNNTPKEYTNRLIKKPVLSLDRKESINVHTFINHSNQKTEVIKKSMLVHETKRDPKVIQIASNTAMNTEVEFCLKKPTCNTQNSTVNKENWVQNVRCDNFLKKPTQKVPTLDAAVSTINEAMTDDDVDKPQYHLNNDDLRFVLQAKRRKLKSCNVGTPGQTEDIFPSLSQQFNNDLKKLNERVKQVRFDFENLKEAEKDEESSMPEESDIQTVDSENVIETYSSAPQVMNISYLKSLAEPFMKTDPWYVVVDIGVLLDDFEFIEDFVKKDATCRILVPNSVRSYIETMSVGEYGGRSWVMLARKAMRRLKKLENFVVLQPPIMESSSTSAMDGTIECCLQVLESNHAVLLTTDTELYTKGIASGIHTFILDDIKKSVDKEPKLSFKQGINVEVQVDNNIFMQNTDNLKAFSISKNDMPKNNNNFDVFKVPAAIKKKQRKGSEGNKLDIRKPMIFGNSNDPVKTTSNKIKLIRKKVDVKEKVETNIEDDIKMLSLHDTTPQNTKVSDNLKGVPKRYFDLDIKKIIVNTNMQSNKDENNLQNSKCDQSTFENPNDTTPQNTKVSDNLKGVPKRYFDLDIKKIIVNTNMQSNKDENNLQNSKCDQSTFDNPNDMTPQNTKVSDNLKGVPKRYYDLDIKKIVVNTNMHSNKDENNLQNSKSDQSTFENPIRNSQTLGNGLREVCSTSEFGMKIKPLTITVPGKQQYMNSSAKDGKKKEQAKINAYTMEDLLKRFQVRDEAMNKRVENRLDEWVCWFYQIMEDCLSEVLMNNTQAAHKKLPAPWSFLEAILCLKEAYPNDTGIKTVTERLCAVLSNLSDKDDKLKHKIKAADFMRLFGCGALLVEALKSTLPESAQVTETQKLLKTLLQNIEDPSTDIDLPFTPMRVARSEMDDMESLNRNIVLKKPSEIIGYLKVHFPAWKDFDEKQLPPEIMKKQEKDFPKEQTVVRTLGKNLNTIKINHAKKITFDDIPANNTPEFKDDTKYSKQKDIPKITRTVDIIQIKQENFTTKKRFDNDMNKPTDKELTSPKYNKEETSIWNDFTEDVSLDYEFKSSDDYFPPDGIVEFDDNAIPFVEDKMGENNDGEVNDISLFDGEVNDMKQGDDKVNCYDSTADSGFVNQSLDACAFIRLFLSELSSSFKLIYTFIDDSINEFRSDGVQKRDKKVLYDKANETHLYVADIIGKLKRIVEREASENTKLKSLIINAGVEALTDKRMTRYRQVTMKCLEQAQLLEGALKTMLALTNEHCDITTLDIDSTGHVQYFNIFE